MSNPRPKVMLPPKFIWENLRKNWLTLSGISNKHKVILRRLEALNLCDEDAITMIRNFRNEHVHDRYLHLTFNSCLYTKNQH